MGETPQVFSEPPMNSKLNGRPVTFADVAMRLIQDMPLFVLMSIVGVLAIQGHADSRDFIITGLGSLLARSWPKAVQVAGQTGIAIFFGLVLTVKLAACSVHPSVPYGAELQVCHEKAKAKLPDRLAACKESIACENDVRARQKPPRPPRVITSWENCE